MDPFLKSSRGKNYIQYFGIILIPFVTFLLGFTVGYDQIRQLDARNNTQVVGPNTQNNSPAGNINKNVGTNYIAPKDVDLTLFWKVWDMLESLYIDQSKIDSQQMTYGAIKGMVDSLKDPYTIFMDPKETEDFKNNLSGDLEGIGAELSMKDGHLIVVSPLKDSPAEKAGLKPSDAVYKINDEVTTKMSLADAVSKIRGQKGTKVKLVIIREGQEKPLEFEIERQEIKVPSVSWEMKDDGIAYISINQFGDDTTKEFSNAVNEILLKKAKSVILDLRYNGGGYLEGAVDIVSEFIDNGVVTTIHKREVNNKINEEVQRVSGHARLSKLPMVVLVNEGSASASEIVAGALRDYKRAQLVGEKTFGKGTVQELQPLSDGSSLRITIAKWYTPNNENVNETGIMPDVEVKITEEDQKNKKDSQLDKAIEILKTQQP